MEIVALVSMFLYVFMWLPRQSKVLDLTKESTNQTSLGVPGDSPSSSQPEKFDLPLQMVLLQCGLSSEEDFILRIGILNQGKAVFVLPISIDQVRTHRSEFHHRRTAVFRLEVLDKTGARLESRSVKVLFSSDEDKDSSIHLKPGESVEVKLNLGKFSPRLSIDEKAKITLVETDLKDHVFEVQRRSNAVSSTLVTCAR